MLLELCEKRSGRAGTRGWLWAQGPMAAAGGETVTQEAASPAEEASGRTRLQALQNHLFPWDWKPQPRQACSGSLTGACDSLTESDFLVAFLLAHSTASKCQTIQGDEATGLPRTRIEFQREEQHYRTLYSLRLFHASRTQRTSRRCRGGHSGMDSVKRNA